MFTIKYDIEPLNTLFLHTMHFCKQLVIRLCLPLALKRVNYLLRPSLIADYTLELYSAKPGIRKWKG